MSAGMQPEKISEVMVLSLNLFNAFFNQPVSTTGFIEPCMKTNIHNVFFLSTKILIATTI